MFPSALKPVAHPELKELEKEFDFNSNTPGVIYRQASSVLDLEPYWGLVQALYQTDYPDQQMYLVLLQSYRLYVMIPRAKRVAVVPDTYKD